MTAWARHTLRSITLMLGLSLAAPAQHDANTRTLRQVSARVEQFSQAFVAADAARLAALLTADYRHTNSNGSVLNKAQWLNYIASRKAELDSGQLKIASYFNQDVQIRLYGATAIVTGRNLSTGIRDGRAFEMQLRFTHVWVRQKGQWLRAAFHDSAIALPTQ